MVTQDDQPRPDLDAAVDAVLPSLTAVSDDAAAASLRRTRIALADAAPGRAGAGAWRWGLAAAAAALIVLASALALWRGRAPEPGSIVEQRPANPAVVTTPLAPSTPPVAPLPVAPQRRRERRARAAAIRATPQCSRAGDVSRANDSGVVPAGSADRARARRAGRFPEDAWQRSAALAAEPVSVPDVSFSPIDVAPLETPPIADVSAEPLAPGEP